MSQAEESARAALGQARFEAEFAAGKRLSRDAAIGLALGEQQHAAAAAVAVANGADGPLGNREADVARLVAAAFSVIHQRLRQPHAIEQHTSPRAAQDDH